MQSSLLHSANVYMHQVCITVQTGVLTEIARLERLYHVAAADKSCASRIL